MRMGNVECVSVAIYQRDKRFQGARERDLSRSEMTNSCHLPGSLGTWYLNPPFHEHLLASFGFSGKIPMRK